MKTTAKEAPIVPNRVQNFRAIYQRQKPPVRRLVSVHLRLTTSRRLLVHATTPNLQVMRCRLSTLAQLLHSHSR